MYSDLARATLEAYEPAAAGAKPIFMYLPWQNVHSPYQAPVDWTGDVLRGMLASTDAALAGVVGALKAKGMWQHSVLFYTADNGGTDRGSNWPLRCAALLAERCRCGSGWRFFSSLLSESERETGARACGVRSSFGLRIGRTPA